MPKTTRATIKDVANLAKVSIATASRVLSKSEYPVAQELRKRILDAATSLNYVPNIFGKALKSGKSSEIGVIVPSLSNPFYAETIAGIEKQCRLSGYNPVFCSSDNEPGRENLHIDYFLQKRVAGMLISTINPDSTYILNAISHYQNIVLFDQPVSDICSDSVTFDFYQAGMMVAKHLIAKSHKNIAFLSTPFDRDSRKARFKGFRDELVSCGVGFDEKNLFIRSIEESNDESEPGIDEFKNGKGLAKLFINDNCDCTAIVAINDIAAFGIINCLVKNLVRIPNDVSVISFDNISLSAMINPPLTTINQPSFEMGLCAAKLLIDRISNPTSEFSHVVLQPHVVERESIKNIGVDVL